VPHTVLLSPDAPARAAHRRVDRDAIDGDTIMRVRGQMDLTPLAFALAIGVHRNTLYRWEADGYVRRTNAPAAWLLIRWLVTLDAVFLASLGSRVKEDMARRGADYVTLVLFGHAASTVKKELKSA
jgi:DNA-binding XRE family transcriptional regulator